MSSADDRIASGLNEFDLAIRCACSPADALRLRVRLSEIIERAQQLEDLALVTADRLCGEKETGYV